MRNVFTFRQWTGSESERVCRVTSEAEECQSLMIYAAENQIYIEAHAKTKTPNNIFKFIQHMYHIFNWVS